MTDQHKRLLAVLVSMRRAGFPRRHLKRALRDAGMTATADALDQLLDELDSLTDVERAEIDAIASKIDQDREPQGRQTAQDLDHGEWFVCESAAADREFILYIGTDTSFLGEIFESAADAPSRMEHAPLDEGQVLSNILWLDGEPPEDASQLRRLFRDARAALRLYEQRLDLDLPPD